MVSLATIVNRINANSKGISSSWEVTIEQRPIRWTFAFVCGMVQEVWLQQKAYRSVVSQQVSWRKLDDLPISVEATISTYTLKMIFGSRNSTHASAGYLEMGNQELGETQQGAILWMRTQL